MWINRNPIRFYGKITFKKIDSDLLMNLITLVIIRLTFPQAITLLDIVWVCSKIQQQKKSQNKTINTCRFYSHFLDIFGNLFHYQEVL